VAETAHIPHADDILTVCTYSPLEGRSDWPVERYEACVAVMTT
jgi:hypothetical protein